MPLFAAAFFPSGGQSIAVCALSHWHRHGGGDGFILRHTLLEATSRVHMELPPYHMPTLRGLLLRVSSPQMFILALAGSCPHRHDLEFSQRRFVTDGSFGRTNARSPC